VRAGGLEPPQALRPYGFSYHFGFRRRHLAFVVWTIPSPWHEAVGAARLVSTPSPWRGLGSGLPVKVSPNLSSSAPGVSPRALKGLSPMRLPVSPRPHGSIYTLQIV
jgi:hypothetical protein